MREAVLHLQYVAERLRLALDYLPGEERVRSTIAYADAREALQYLIPAVAEKV